MKTPMRAWGYWLVCSAFFLFSYIIRIAPSGLMDQLMRSFSITAVSIGLLGSVFYIGYLAMQVPSGYLIDRFGTKNTVSTALIVCAASTLLFCYSTTFSGLILARTILGFAATFSFIGAIKLATNWFCPRTLGLVVGLTQATGMLGAALGSGPVLQLYGAFDWRHVLTVLAAIFVVLALLMRFWVQEGPKKKQATQASTPAGKVVFTSRQSWVNALFAGFLYAPILTLGEVWGTPYVMQVHNLSQTSAGSAFMWMFIGLTIGGPLGGKLSDIFGRKPIMLFSSLATFAGILSLLMINMSALAVTATLFFVGLCNFGVVASLTVAGEMHPDFATGLSVSFCNLVSLAIGAVMQSIVGLVLDLLWSGNMVAGLPVYSNSEYFQALLSLPCMGAIAFVLALFIKETLADARKNK